MIQEFEIVEIGVEEGVDLVSSIKDYLHLNVLLEGGALLPFIVFISGEHH